MADNGNNAKSRNNGPSGMDFVRIVMQSSSRKEAIEKSGMSPSNFIQRYSSYKKKGIPLRDLPGGKRGRRVDIEGLKALALSLQGVKEESSK